MLKILTLPILIFLQQMPVTFTGIEYIQGTDSLKVSVRINYELFLRDYQQTIFDDLDLEVLRSFQPFPSDLANNYINSKINIYDDKKLIIGKLLKMEENDRDVRFSILYRVEKKLKSITVRNTILTGLYSNVENLIIIRSRNYESEIKLTPEHNEETFIIK
jgi:hypothetical protein